MQIHRATLDTCHTAAGTVIVIDVIRAFTTAAYAFAAGARTITLAGTIEEAFALRERVPGALLAGEVEGLPVNGFDFGNSPGQVYQANLLGKDLIQRTTKGTQGVIRSIQAETILAASFACANATVEFIRRLNPSVLTFVPTGSEPGGDPMEGDEDAALADYLEDLLSGPSPEPAPYLQRVINAPHAQAFLDPDNPDFPKEDLDLCVRLDAVDFAMPVQRRDGLLVMEKWEVPKYTTHSNQSSQRPPGI